MKIPWRLLAYLAVGLVLMAGFNQIAGYIPLTPQWSARQSAAKVAALTQEIAALEATVAGNAEIAASVETFHTREIVYRDVTAQAIADARNAPDAATPLSDERAARLRAADERLCDSSGLCAAPADAAGGGEQALPHADAAG